jgi:predicted metal-binding protein
MLNMKLEKYNNNMSMIKFNTHDFVFEERIPLKCFYCAKYDTKWTCPPRIPKLNYPELINEYQNAAIVICKMNLNGELYEDIREKSTIELHKSLLYLEKLLWELDNPMCLTFIGGSCKLCKNGCAEDKCRNPGLKRIPIEATGINVIKSLKKVDIDISFQRKDYFFRFGLILW